MGESDVDRAYGAMLSRILGHGMPGSADLFARASKKSITKAMSHFVDSVKYGITPETDAIFVSIADIIISLQRSETRAAGDGGLGDGMHDVMFGCPLFLGQMMATNLY